MKNKTFSVRELILFGILVIIVAYYFLVQGPISQQTTELQTEQSTLQSQLDEDQVKVTKLATMKKELKEIKASGKAKSLPSYNNYNNVLRDLNGILASADDYYVAFNDTTETDGIVCRDIEVTYVVDTYAKAVNLLDTIKESDNKYTIRDMSITESSTHDDGVEWTSVVYLAEYEIK